MTSPENWGRIWLSKRKTLLATASLILFGSCYAAAAQSLAPPVAPNSVQQIQEPPPIRARVSEVNTPVVVRGANGQLLLDLAQKDFHVFDNGVEQKIDSFDMGGAPLSIVIVVETSSRVAALLPALRRTGILFTQTVLGQNGDAAVIGYNDDVDTLAGFTGDRDAIEQTFARLHESGSGARLYDALARGVQMLSARPDSRRRVLIAMAEAVDSKSEAKLGQVLRDAQQSGVTIYSIGLSSMRGHSKENSPAPITPPGTFSLPPTPGSPQTPSTDAQRSGNIDLGALAVWVVQHATATIEHPLEVAATATGGLYQSASREKAIPKAIDQISGELHAQYVLSYRPMGIGPGDYHQIKVEISGRKGINVRARPGYYSAPPPG